jgi:hypothetical protein
MSSRYGLLCFAVCVVACDSNGEGSEREALASTPAPNAPGSDAGAASPSDAGSRPLVDAGSRPLPEPAEPRFDASTLPLVDASVPPSGDVESTSRDGGSTGDAAACTGDSTGSLADGDGGISPLSGPPGNSEAAVIPVDAGADGQLCLELCTTRRCFPFAHEFANDGNAQNCLDACVASYRQARAWAPEACVEAMLERDDVYLSAPCDCSSLEVVADFSAQLDRACALSPSAAEGNELGTSCREHCSLTTPGDGEEGCYEQCVADYSRHWLLGGSRCLMLELEYLRCTMQGGDAASCESEAPFYNCLQATR